MKATWFCFLSSSSCDLLDDLLGRKNVKQSTPSVIQSAILFLEKLMYLTYKQTSAFCQWQKLTSLQNTSNESYSTDKTQIAIHCMACEVKKEIDRKPTHFESWRRHGNCSHTIHVRSSEWIDWRINLRFWRWRWRNDLTCTFSSREEVSASGICPLGESRCVGLIKDLERLNSILKLKRQEWSIYLRCINVNFSYIKGIKCIFFSNR